MSNGKNNEIVAKPKWSLRVSVFVDCNTFTPYYQTGADCGDRIYLAPCKMKDGQPVDIPYFLQGSDIGRFRARAESDEEEDDPQFIFEDENGDEIDSAEAGKIAISKIQIDIRPIRKVKVKGTP